MDRLQCDCSLRNASQSAVILWPPFFLCDKGQEFSGLWARSEVYRTGGSPHHSQLLQFLVFFSPIFCVLICRYFKIASKKQKKKRHFFMS